MMAGGIFDQENPLRNAQSSRRKLWFSVGLWFCALCVVCPQPATDDSATVATMVVDPSAKQS
jgi:hypothetical protein